jgi:hypothetical protein
MDDVKINTSKTLSLTLPSDADSNAVTVSLIHEFGDTVQSNISATRVSDGVYSVTFGQSSSGIYSLNSSGIHRIDFNYSISGTSYTQSKYINVYTPYIVWEDFASSHPELVTLAGVFDSAEKRARSIINTFCGQTFEFYPDKSITIDGTDSKNLHLPLPISTLRKVTIDYGDNVAQVIHDFEDETLNNIEKVRQNFNFESSYFIRYKSGVSETSSNRVRTQTFKSVSDYRIEGDFGWRFVPLNIKQAAELIILDILNDDSEYRRHALTSVDMDTMRFTMAGNFYESTGNIEADILLMDYTLFVMDYIT